MKWHAAMAVAITIFGALSLLFNILARYGCMP